jgi:16S rRNA (uracil1498-N3)-methyltransferase
MASHTGYPRTRLFLPEPLGEGLRLQLDGKKSHYLAQVLRQKEGAVVAVFNGTDGEWRCTVESIAKKAVTLAVDSQLRPQKNSADIWLLAAPLKNGKTDWVVEKASELGVSRICPVITQFTVADRINEARLGAIAIEAAEQCERMDVAAIEPALPLLKRLESWPQGRHLMFGDESGAAKNAKDLLPTLPEGPLAVLIGPEGGFSPTELDLLRTLPYVSGMCMGPRVLRADTAALAALTLLQVWRGDWDGKPAFRS